MNRERRPSAGFGKIDNLNKSRVENLSQKREATVDGSTKIGHKSVYNTVKSNKDFNDGSRTASQRPSFIKGDIDIDPEKCQGFFSHGSITFKASTRPGEPSKLSIEYDEEMSRLLQKIVKKKSRFNLICLKRSVGIADEHLG